MRVYSLYYNNHRLDKNIYKELTMLPKMDSLVVRRI